jgi:hypothetical protein
MTRLSIIETAIKTRRPFVASAYVGVPGWRTASVDALLTEEL